MCVNLSVSTLAVIPLDQFYAVFVKWSFVSGQIKIEDDDLRSKVKVTVTEKFYNNEKCSLKIQMQIRVFFIWANIEITLKEIENCTISIPKKNSYCHRKSSARGPRFKVSSEGLSAEIDIPLRSPIQVQTKADVA